MAHASPPRASRLTGLQAKILALVLIPLLLVTIGLVTTSALGQKGANQRALKAQESQLVASRKANIKNIVDSTHTAIQPIIDTPYTSIETKREQVREKLQNVRFGVDNYIWAYDYDGVVTVLGDDPDAIGDNHWQMEGEGGELIVQGMINAGRQNDYYAYQWAHPQTGSVEQKHSYVVDLPKLGWVMGAGIYMNDVAATMATAHAEAGASLKADIVRSSLVGLAAFIMAAIIAGWLVRRLVRPINGTAAAMRDIAQGEGDLTRRLEVRSRDEIGMLAEQFNAFAARMQQTLLDVRRSVYEVRHAANEMAQGSEELASRTEQAAANLQETSSSMEEITSTVNQSSESAQQANQLATSTVTVAQQGGEAMNDVEKTMGDLSDSATRIREIITLIDGIAFQTNILALNASVEAARAGEHGRGFAVVASEVRNLASRSADASSEIRELIDTTVSHTDHGNQAVQRASDTIQQIIKSVTQVTDVISEISAGAREQSAGISQVNTAVTEMDTMTQQNSAMVQQSSSTAESMRDQAGRLGDLVDTFVLGADEAGGPLPGPGARSLPAAAPRRQPALANDDWESF